MEQETQINYKQKYNLLRIVSGLVVAGLVIFSIFSMRGFIKAIGDNHKLMADTTALKQDLVTLEEENEGLNVELMITGHLLESQDSVVDALRIEIFQLSTHVLKEKKLAQRKLKFQEDEYEGKLEELFRQKVDVEVELKTTKASLEDSEADNGKLVKLYGERGKTLASLQRDYNHLNESFLHNNVVINDVVKGRKARQLEKWFTWEKDGLDFTEKGERKFKKRK